MGAGGVLVLLRFTPGDHTERLGSDTLRWDRAPVPVGDSRTRFDQSAAPSLVPGVLKLTASPDGQFLATLGLDDRLMLRDANSGQERVPLRGADSPVRCHRSNT